MSADVPDGPRDADQVDVVYVHGPTPDGTGKVVLRAREDRVEVGAMRPLRDGQPLHGEVVRLTPRRDTERLFDVEVLHASSAPQPPKDSTPGEAAPRRKGPARVSSERYRAGWEAVFGRPARSTN